MQLQTANVGGIICWLNKTDGEQSVDRTQDMLMMAGTQQLLSHLWKSKAEGGDAVGQWGDKQRRLERQTHARRRGCFVLNNRERCWRGENVLYREGADTVCLSAVQKWSFYSFEVCWIKPNVTLRWSGDITGLDCDSQPAVRGGGSAAQAVNLTVRESTFHWVIFQYDDPRTDPEVCNKESERTRILLGPLWIENRQYYRCHFVWG